MVPLVVLELLPASKIIIVSPLRNNLFRICRKQAGGGEVVQNKQTTTTTTKHKISQSTKEAIIA